MDRENVVKQATEKNIKFVQLQFMDILGFVKNVTIPSTKLGDAMDKGIVFDGSSIVGYATIDESDFRLVPLPKSFQTLPWEKDSMKTARLICNIHKPDGSRFEGDPRHVLERTIKRAEDMGYHSLTGPEYEFFLLKMDQNHNPVMELSDSGGYFDLLPLDKGELVRKRVVEYANELGFDAEMSHHEVAPGQHEVDLKYADALVSADRVLLLKHMIKSVAMNHDLYATFMPKPLSKINGNGMHVHQSLMDFKGNNVFYDPDDENELSQTALYYIGGLLEHAQETCAILASWVNSYKRLVPGYEAPVYISWANRNRSALVRVPAGRESSTRVEMRNPDPAGNPYLQFALMINAGLDGIKKKIMPPESVERDIYKLNQAERQNLGIKDLPGNLGQALSFFKKSELALETLGPHIFDHFIIIKSQEWGEYKAQVSQWEIDKYLPVL